MNLQTTTSATHRTLFSSTRRNCRFAVLPLLLLGLCSCANNRDGLTGDPFASDVSDQTVNAHVESMERTDREIKPAIHVESMQFVTPAGASVESTGSAGIVPMAGEEYCPVPGGSPGLFAPAGPVMTEADNEASPVKHPDEYIYDGGDREDPVHFTQFQMQGLDPEDAVAEYRDDLGVRHVKKSTRVAVYSPRFAAVSVISTLGEGVAVNRVGGSVLSQFGAGFRGRTAPILQNQPTGAERMRTRSRASGVGSDSWATAVDNPVVVSDHVKTLNLFESYVFVQTGQLESTETAGISGGVQAAAVWSHEQYPVISASTSGANEVYARFIPQEIAGLDDPDRREGRLRIVKLADKRTAKRGEVITFTIRYDNIGDRPVHDVAIMDNLTSRLSYIDDTQTADHQGRFVTEDNGVGSLVLRWELDKPLAGGEGGVVTFKTRVE